MPNRDEKIRRPPESSGDWGGNRRPALGARCPLFGILGLRELGAWREGSVRGKAASSVNIRFLTLLAFSLFPPHCRPQSHRRQHNKDKPFKCHNCHRAYTDAASLEVHLATHTVKHAKVYTCSICSRAYTSVSISSPGGGGRGGSAPQGVRPWGPHGLWLWWKPSPPLTPPSRCRRRT